MPSTPAASENGSEMGVFADVLEFLVLVLKAIGVLILTIYRCFIPPAQKSVRDRVVLITGTGSGLGRLLAQKFALLGAKVVMVDIDETRNKETLETVKQMQCKGYAYSCDVSNENQVEALADKVTREVGTVDILINNAGIMVAKPLLEISNEQIKRTLQINTLSHFWMIRQFLPQMLDKGEGQIVAIASIAGLLGCSNLVDYCASKFAVMGLMAALREELNDTGKEDFIQLTVICPSTMDTGMVEHPKTRFPSLLPILNVEDVSAKVVKAVLENKRILVLPTIAHSIYKVACLLPQQVFQDLQRYFDYTIEPNSKQM